MIKPSPCLEFAFKVEVISSEVILPFETPGIAFDAARMANEFGNPRVPAPRKRNKIAGTTEVGVGESVCGRLGERRRVD